MIWWFGSSHTAPTTAAGPSSGLQNDTPSYVRPPSVPQGSWGAAVSGHATMADIVKANGTPLQPPPLAAPVATSSTAPSASTSALQQGINAGTVPTPVASGVYSSSTDPVLHPSLDLRAGASGAIKREIGTVGNQRTKGDWQSPLSMDPLASPSITSQQVQTAQTSTSSPVDVAGSDRESKATGPNTPSVSGALPSLQDRAASHTVVDITSSGGVQSRHGPVTSLGGLTAPRAAVGGGSFGRPMYLSQQHPVGTQKG